MKHSIRTSVAAGLALAAFLTAGACTSNGEFEMAENEFQDNEQDPFDSAETVSHEDPEETEVTRKFYEEAHQDDVDAAAGDDGDEEDQDDRRGG